MNRSSYVLFCSLLFGIVLSGCNGGSPPTAATESTEALEKSTAAITATNSPEITPTAAAPTQTAVINTSQPDEAAPATPTAVPLVDPSAEFPEAAIRLLRPGPGSKVISPFFLETNFLPTASGLLRIELFGEDGRSLMRQIRRYTVPGGRNRMELIFQIEFEIEALSELGRITVSIDDEFGRLQALASTDLILLSVGSNEINPPQDGRENIIIQQPIENILIEGDTLALTGLVRTENESPLGVEIITEAGKVVGAGTVGVAAEAGQEYGLFAGEVNYSVSEPVWVRLVVSERDRRIPGIKHLSSLEFALSP